VIKKQHRNLPTILAFFLRHERLHCYAYLLYMLERITEIYDRYQELTRLLADPEIIADRDEYRKLAKEHAELEPLARSFLRWKKNKGGVGI